MPTAIDTATAVGYFRVSSPGQAGELHVSLEVQAAAFQDYCRTHQLDSVTTFTDVASGRKDDRKKNRKMVDPFQTQRYCQVQRFYIPYKNIRLLPVGR